jgi:hypothetical protein
MTNPQDHERLEIASRAFELIDAEIRPFLAVGGQLWTKGSNGYPARLRQILRGLDKAHRVTFATHEAMQLHPENRVVEHVIPMKRIVIEIIDPSQADPRSNSNNAPIADGPAQSPQHLITIFDTLLQKCWVTPTEHERLNRAGRSFQWDAPDGDGWARYRSAGIEAYSLDETGEGVSSDN